MGHFLSKLQEPHFQSDLSTLVGFISSKIALVGDIKLHENYFPWHELKKEKSYHQLHNMHI